VGSGIILVLKAVNMDSLDPQQFEFLNLDPAPLKYLDQLSKDISQNKLFVLKTQISTERD